MKGAPGFFPVFTFYRFDEIIRRLLLVSVFLLDRVRARWWRSFNAGEGDEAAVGFFGVWGCGKYFEVYVFVDIRLSAKLFFLNERKSRI